MKIYIKKALVLLTLILYVLCALLSGCSKKIDYKYEIYRDIIITDYGSKIITCKDELSFIERKEDFDFEKYDDEFFEYNQLIFIYHLAPVRTPDYIIKNVTLSGKTLKVKIEEDRDSDKMVSQAFCCLSFVFEISKDFKINKVKAKVSY